MSQETGTESDRSRVAVLDGLRGLAVLGVMVFHFVAGRPPLKGPFGRLLTHVCQSGQTGVDLFFVLSGFLITGILLQARGAPRALPHFFARRALRILPLYVVLLAFLEIWRASVPGLALGHDGWWYWTFLQDIGLTFFQIQGPNHFWSLAVEEHYYLLWPFVVLFVPLRHLKQIAWGLLAGTVALRAAFVAQGLGVGYFTLCRLDPIVIGSLLAIWNQEPGRLTALRRRVGPWLPAAVVVSALIYWATSGRGWATTQVFKYAAQGFFYGALLVAAVTAPSTSVWHRFLIHPALTKTGQYSYALYLLHGLLFNALGRGFPMHPLPGMVLAFGVTYAAAWLSWVLLERPCLSLKRYFPMGAASARDGSAPLARAA